MMIDYLYQTTCLKGAGADRPVGMVQGTNIISSSSSYPVPSDLLVTT